MEGGDCEIPSGEETMLMEDAVCEEAEFCRLF